LYYFGALEGKQERLYEDILIFCLRSSLFWDIVQRRLFIDVSGQYISPIFKGKTVLPTPPTFQNSEDLKHAMAEF
jgi:hypothetical protein